MSHVFAFYNPIKQLLIAKLGDTGGSQTTIIMKKFKFIAFLLFATMLSVNLTSCGDDDEPGDIPGTQGSDKKEITVEGVSFNMIKVKGGTFLMGSDDSEAADDEKPVHSVTLSDYYIGETEVTQELWEAVMGANPSDFSGSNKPVECVSWDDCQEFIAKLNDLTGLEFRLPTEAEWEYAARGGNKSLSYEYAGSNTIGEVAWYDDNAYDVGESSPDYGTHPVGTKSPNELGIYDMSGNVKEWCIDRYGRSYYSSSLSTNPRGPTSGYYRVHRGGGWYNFAQNCRVSDRNYDTPSYRYYSIGFRLVRDL